jgi:hypothetical protein
MKNRSTGVFAAAIFGIFISFSASAQTKLDSMLPVRGFCIDAPRPAGIDSFVHFIENDLAPVK